MIIKNAKVFIDGQFHDKDIKIENGMISEVGTNLAGKDIIDASDMLVFPGFIETHIHGGAGERLASGGDTAKKISAWLPQYGITSWVPTPTATNVEDSLIAVRGIRAAKGSPGADILGISYYSPYKNRSISYYPDKLPPTKEHTLAMMDGDISDLLIVSVAPELLGGMEYIKWLKSQNIIPMIAFTEATTAEIYEAADNGATLLDHFFNGFPPMKHSEEGSTIGCLLEDRLWCQMQMDHVHVTEPFIRLTMRVKGADRIIAVHDGSEFVGSPDGEYFRGTDPDSPTYRLIKKDGAVRNKDGKLVTGCRSYDENMRTAYSKGYALEDIGMMFSENAAKALGITDRGKIEVGRRADLVIMNKELFVQKTFILGGIVFSV